MTSPRLPSAAAEARVRIAALVAARAPGTLATVGIGSCVAVALYDAAAGVGGLAHVLLPSPDAARDASNPAKFASTAVPRLLAEMQALGSTGPTVAWLAGGATMFAALAGPASRLGDRNVAAARAALAGAGVPIVGEDVGGEHGRSVYFDVGAGRVTVRSIADGDVRL